MNIATASVADIAIPMASVLTLITAGIAYGRMNEKVEQAHTRVAKVELELATHGKETSAKLDEIRESIHTLHIMFAEDARIRRASGGHNP